MNPYTLYIAVCLTTFTIVAALAVREWLADKLAGYDRGAREAVDETSLAVEFFRELGDPVAGSVPCMESQPTGAPFICGRGVAHRGHHIAFGPWRTERPCHKDATVSEKCERHFARGPHWHYAGDGWDRLDDPLSLGKFRQVVVIDPEDREQVARLIHCLSAQDARAGLFMDNISQALREFANPTPPKMDEPEGWLSVVKDREDALWYRWSVRPSDRSKAWISAWDEGRCYPTNWSDIHAVEVLSEGVTP